MSEYWYWVCDSEGDRIMATQGGSREQCLERWGMLCANSSRELPDGFFVMRQKCDAFTEMKEERDVLLARLEEEEQAAERVRGIIFGAPRITLNALGTFSVVPRTLPKGTYALVKLAKVRTEMEVTKEGLLIPEPTTTPQTCEGCRHAVLCEGDTRAFCQRRAPKPASNLMGGAMWPVVNKHDHCGEWEAK